MLFLGLKSDLKIRNVVVKAKNKIKVEGLTEKEAELFVISQLDKKQPLINKALTLKAIREVMFQPVVSLKVTIAFLIVFVGTFSAVTYWGISELNSVGLNIWGEDIFVKFTPENLPKNDRAWLDSLCSDPKVISLSGLNFRDTLQYFAMVLDDSVNVKIKKDSSSQKLLHLRSISRIPGELDSLYSAIVLEGVDYSYYEDEDYDLHPEKYDSIIKMNKQKYNLLKIHEDSIWNSMDSIKKLSFVQTKFETKSNYNDSCIWFKVFEFENSTDDSE